MEEWPGQVGVGWESAGREGTEVDKYDQFNYDLFFTLNNNVFFPQINKPKC